MKKILSWVVSSAIVTIMFCAGCGGGGGSTPPAQATTAVLTLSSTGTLPAGTQIGGINMTVTIPATVSVKATPSKANPSAQVTYSTAVTASGVAAGANTITLAALTAPTAVSVLLANPNGFGIGEFAKITFDITAGNEVVPGEFSSAAFSAVDTNGAPIQGLSAGVDAVVQ